LSSIAALLVSRKPVFSTKACTLCETCIDICPAKALSMGDKKPSIDRGLCIRCYCCAEVCPSHAISLSRRPLRSVGDRLARAAGLR
jgi:formate hydrogenlyase subunit 6/NADH:ubiquinone oxidoreductase subunit I